ncbi:MAG: hypothetical protein J0M01_07585 [Dechloromonas sp.]|mgnify:CR=1 FL=1|jgi:hypothetical protein|nr:hypothetical protein [Dechloromonas sp.]
MHCTTTVTSLAQPGTVFVEVEGPYYDREGNMGSVHIRVSVRDRRNDKIEEEVEFFFEAASAMVIGEVLLSIGRAAQKLMEDAS